MPSPTRPPAPAWGVVVPAGGRGSRLGGVDKPALRLGGRGLLEHLLDGLPAGVPVALVGPPRPLALEVGRPVLRCREEPPGGGPAAALAAGVVALLASAAPAAHGDGPAQDGLDVVVVLPGDAPHAAAAVPALLSALSESPGAEAAVAVDAGGRRQVLVAAHRAGALAARLAELRRQHGQHDRGGLAGLPAARLLPPADRLVEVAVAADALADVDSPGDLERLEHLHGLRRARGAGPA